jgi:hypothetical protein
MGLQVQVLNAGTSPNISVPHRVCCSLRSRQVGLDVVVVTLNASAPPEDRMVQKIDLQRDVHLALERQREIRTACRAAEALFGVPLLRPPRRSPGFDPPPAMADNACARLELRQGGFDDPERRVDMVFIVASKSLGLTNVTSANIAP